MTALKLCGAALLMVSAVLTGLELSSRRRAECLILDEACAFCQHIKSCISYERSVPYEILRSFSCSRGMLCSAAAAHMDSGSEFHDAWRAAISEMPSGVISDESRQLLLQLGTGLGFTGVDGELLRLERLYLQLDSVCRLKRQEYPEKRRVYVSVCVLAGVFAAIIFC